MSTLVSLRNYLLAAAAIAVLVAIPISERLRFDQRIEAFFADDNPDLQILIRSRQDFGGDEFVILAWTEERLFDVEVEPYPATLDDVLKNDVLLTVAPGVAERIRDTVLKVNAVEGVNSEQTQDLADFLDSAPRSKSTRRAMLRLIEGTLVGRDGKTTGIMLQLLPEEASKITRGQTLEAIRQIAHSMNAEVAVAGEPVQVFDMFQMVEQDGQLLFLVSLAILSIVLLAMFRRFRWVLAPVGLVLGSVVATRTILVLVGAELSMVSSMLNSLVTVIGIATCMHVAVHYRDLRHRAARAAESSETESISWAARQTLSDMAAPIFWTCLTTGVGFGSLLVSQITPVRSFSVMMCLATGVVLLGCCVVLPATLASGSGNRPPATVVLESWLDRALLVNCRTVQQRPIVTGLVCLLLVAAAVPGIFQLVVETDFSRNFKESSTIVRSLKFVESRLGGAGTWEVSFDAPKKLNDDFLNDVGRLTTALEMTQIRPEFEQRTRALATQLAHSTSDQAVADRFEALTSSAWLMISEQDFLSPGDIDEFCDDLNQKSVSTELIAEVRQLLESPGSTGTNQSGPRVLSLSSLADLPPRILGPAKTLQRIERKQPALIASFYNKDAGRMRILLRSMEQQAAEEKVAQITRIRQCVEDFFDSQNVHPQESKPVASGMFVLLAELIRSLLSDQLVSFAVACGGIFTCMTIAFRSVRIGTISLFPNMFPVALVMGALGWIGEPVNIGTAMITSVSMGLTVDSTIHYITAFERARQTHSVAESLQIAHAGAGRAVVFASLALVAGFLVLTASRFIPLVYFGALLSLSMLSGIFGDLVLLPLLLRLVTRETILTSETSVPETNV